MCFARGHEPRRRLILLLLAAATAAAAGDAHLAGAQSLVQKPTPAHFVAVQSPDNCHGGAGIAITPVKNAVSYTVSYWDGYWQRVITGGVTLDQVKQSAIDYKGYRGLPKGDIFVGVTGGWGSPPCKKTALDGTYGGRFSKGAKAWAVFPYGYKPPTLKVSVSLSDSGIAVGHETDVKVTVTAGKVAFKRVNLAKGLDGLKDIAKVTKSPSGTSGFPLAAGASKSFTFTVKALQPGAAAIAAKATGSSKNGTASGHGSATLRVAKSVLAVTMDTSPGRVPLEVNDEGKVKPKKVVVTVRLTNTGETELKHVSLQSLHPEPVDPTQRLDQLAFEHAGLPIEIGSIPAKGHETRTFELEVTGDGAYQIRALALFEDKGATGGNGISTAIGGKFKATVPVLWFKTKRDDDNITEKHGAPWIVGGKTWYISGKLVNESSYRTLCVAPFAPTLAGNAAGTGPIDITEKSLRDIGGPYAGAIAPGKDVSLQMFVDTAEAGGTRSQVTLKPQAVEIDAGTNCNQDTYKGGTKLDPGDVKVVGDGSDFLVHVDVSEPQPGELSYGARFAGAVFGIGKALFVETAKQAIDLVALAREFRSTEAEYERMYPLAPPYAAWFTIKSAQALQVATDVYATYWKLATQEEKDNLYYEVGNVLNRVSNDFYTNAVGTVKDAAAPWMGEMEKAYAKGDDFTIGRLWGEVAGSVIQQVVLGMFIEKAGATILADSARLEAKAAKAGEEWAAKDVEQVVTAEEHPVETASGDAPNPATEEKVRVAKSTVEPGTELSLAEKQAVWGIDAASDTAFADIAKDCECLIGVRSRAPESVGKLEGGSVWKHENLKPKNVNDIDVEYLGFRKGDLSEVRLRTYTNEQEAAIRQRIASANLSAEEKAAILDRFETRLGERQYVSKIEGFSKKGQINVGFNYRDNGIDRMNTSALRKFDLESAKIPAEDGLPAGGTYYTPFQENPQYAKLAKSGGKLPPNCREALLSVLCTVTGDVDGVYVTALDGSALPMSKMVEVYKRLQAIGWQHPETLTWVNNEGEFLFKAKEKILKSLEVGGEAMVEYAPDGVTRATYFNLEGSSLVGRDNFHVQIVGGYHDATAATTATAIAR